MKRTRQVGISFPLDLLERVDKERGLIPRSRYIVAIVEKHLKKSESVASENCSEKPEGV